MINSITDRPYGWYLASAAKRYKRQDIKVPTRKAVSCQIFPGLCAIFYALGIELILKVSEANK